MHRLVLLVALALPSSALAQFGPPPVAYDVLAPNRTPLAGAAEVPTAFLLGLDGATPLFVNPARAAHAEHRFAYGTVGTPDVSGGAPSPVSLTGLFGSGDGHWLIVAENAVRTQNDDRTDESSFRDDRDPNNTFLQVSELADVFSNAGVDTRARAVYIGRTDYGGFAVGLFGGYRTSASTRMADRDQTVERVSRTPSVDEVQLDERFAQDEAEQDRDAFGIGAEFALAGRTWDLAASVAYQGRSEFEGQSIVRLDREAFDQASANGSTFERLDRREFETESRLEAAPSGVSFDAVGTLRTSVRRGDYLYAAISGAYVSSTADAALSFSEERLFRTVTDGTATEDRFSDSGEAEGEGDLDERATRLALGYVFAREKRGRILLAGVVPSGSVERQTTIDAALGSDIRLLQIERERVTLGVELPIHVQIPVGRRLALFGGGVYAYRYEDLTETQTTLDRISTLPDLPPDVPPTPEPEQTFTLETDAFASSTRLYGGALLHLRPGFSAQAAFRGDIAQFSGWTVSLGYRF